MREPQTIPQIISLPVPDEAEAVWQRPASLGFSFDPSAWAEPEGELAIDVCLAPAAVVVRSAVAGVAPEDLSIALHNDLLTIRGRRLLDESETATAHYVLQECHWGSFSRSVLLPVSVSPEGSEAVLKNGILKITLRRTAPAALSIRLDEHE